MFELIALLFLLSAPDKPVGQMTYNKTTFQTAQECKEFAESDQEDLQRIEAVAASKQIGVKFACIKVEDNSI